MYPNVVIVLLKANIIALSAVAVHKAKVSYLNVGSICDAETEAVENCVISDTLDSNTAGQSLGGAVALYQKVAALKSAGVSHISDKAETERSGLIALLICRKDRLNACTGSCTAL